MVDTKENILQAALRLFSQDGYEAVSVSAIAAKLGVTKPALYKHYKSKRDIFDHIVERMVEIDMQKAAAFDVPVGAFVQTPGVSREAVLEKIKSFSLAMFRYWTEDRFASNFRKMLTLEQYRNPEAAALLNRYLTGGVIDYTEDLMREAIASTAYRDKDVKVLAVEYFAPIYLMMNRYDGTENKADAVQMVEKHIEYFMDTLYMETRGKK
ncbi:TetR/AcrR family transcriptional regulator [Parasphaerochaeta coccoides]|uniref:Regulatory protein TetR n=1 Tax=Parasphaerochaeta coccoides (strain ATCC BAA-1237 / DSM 17374 / SPN1) TaxID=760011 RepID=F4GK17_PARC1|nr:TetR/AcrR family transcriptional regulator [Parasphaerochaeta coccoides]AEC01789.1 regulatory protein TetR [Parasphaerochaeta coccoides DSM 17374]